jgi:uncharacterized protein
MDAQIPISPPINAAVLKLLRCPVTGRPLIVENRDGVATLATDDGRIAYPIRDGIPVLLPAPSEARKD